MSEIPTVNEKHFPSEGVTADLKIDKIDGEYLDTCITLSGLFWVAGNQRHEFLEKLGNLIDEYRI